MVLIAEDNADTAAIVGLLLKHEGQDSLILSCGEDVLTHLESQQQRPSLIILDISMPRCDGIECLKMIRASLQWRDIPVVIYSGEQDRFDEARRLGAKAVIPKGLVAWPALLNAIKQYAC